MNRLSCRTGVALLLITGLSPYRASAQAVSVKVDVLSDTGGTDLHPYLSALISMMQTRWRAIDAGSAKQRAAGRETTLEVTLRRDGHLQALRQQGTADDEFSSRVAWDVVKDSIFQPLPGALKSENLRLRLHFVGS